MPSVGRPRNKQHYLTSLHDIHQRPNQRHWRRTCNSRSNIDETEGYVDTGSYIFNALVSGSIYGGISGNKITAIAGESSTGKTFFALAVVRNFLDNNPDAIVVYFDTESAITRSLLEDRNIDTLVSVVMNVVTIEEFRTKALQCVDKYYEDARRRRQPMMFVLDSLGMLSTEKEIGDALADKNVRDMTKSQLVKGAFRMLTLKLGQANVPAYCYQPYLRCHRSLRTN
jgi:RecA/RadA recombinase